MRKRIQGKAWSIDPDPWINLAGAIIRDVANDYVLALVKNNKTIKEDCERWFKSYWYRVYSLGLPPDAIIRRCKKLAVIEKRRRRRLNGTE